MQRWIAAPLGLALAITLAAEPSVALAQKPDPPEAVTIETADGVKLHGLLHKTAKGAAAPVVLLLYPPGVDNKMSKGDWEGLANRLTTEGYHVFRFDWRGHGKSTDISNPVDFWTNPYTGPANNKYIAGANKKPLKNTLFVKEIKPQYFPVYVNDLTAVRMYLDQINDKPGVLNTSSIYVIGAEETAALGALWLTAEWNRWAICPDVLLTGGKPFRVITQPAYPPVGDGVPEAGKDIAGAIWLSPSRPTYAPSMSQRLIQTWVQKTLPLRDNNPMLFLYGADDKPGLEHAKYFFDEVLVANGDKNLGIKKLDQTFIRTVPGTKLRGVNLLGESSKLGTEDTIVKYLAQLQKERASKTVKERKYNAPYFVNLGNFGINP